MRSHVARDRLRVQRARIGQRIGDARDAVGETVVAQRDAVPRKLRRERIGARGEIPARLVVSGSAKPLALRVAEDAREEHVGVLALRLEQHDVGVRILARGTSPCRLSSANG